MAGMTNSIFDGGNGGLTSGQTLVLKTYLQANKRLRISVTCQGGFDIYEEIASDSDTEGGTGTWTRVKKTSSTALATGTAGYTNVVDYETGLLHKGHRIVIVDTSLANNNYRWQIAAQNTDNY